MDKNLIVAIVLGILVVVSAIQAVQLSSLKAKLSSGTLSTSGAKVSSSLGGSSGGAASVPSNLQNLPSMVGGC
ncbi:hypothetical protein HZB00_02055 [Candidatus Woesearchaeota archaeon]|nr:hypothetical protein [Candidatus Woesearchaeota archaeon]